MRQHSTNAEAKLKKCCICDEIIRQGLEYGEIWKNNRKLSVLGVWTDAWDKAGKWFYLCPECAAKLRGSGEKVVRIFEFGKGQGKRGA